MSRTVVSISAQLPGRAAVAEYQAGDHQRHKASNQWQGAWARRNFVNFRRAREQRQQEHGEDKGGEDQRALAHDTPPGSFDTTSGAGSAAAPSNSAMRAAMRSKA